MIFIVFSIGPCIFIYTYDCCLGIFIFMTITFIYFSMFFFTRVIYLICSNFYIDKYFYIYLLVLSSKCGTYAPCHPQRVSVFLPSTRASKVRLRCRYPQLALFGAPVVSPWNHGTVVMGGSGTGTALKTFFLLMERIWLNIHLSNGKRAPGGVWYIGDEILPSFLGIIINHYKDPFALNECFSENAEILHVNWLVG